MDFLSFSMRVDSKSPVRFNDVLDFSYICKFLKLPESGFANMGRIKYYKERYECNNISVSVPYDARENQQGYNISMSGNGCRYYEAHIKDSEFIDVSDIWRGLFSRLRELTKKGIAVNVSRLDIAVDDFSGALDIERIERCIDNDEVATRFQKKTVDAGGNDIYIATNHVKTSFFRRIRSKTISFGSRESRSYCRIYDKKAEQMQKHFNDEDKTEFNRLDKIPHWVRLEVEFKDENALSMVNAFIDEKHFPHFFASYINGMLRFIKRDSANTSRCTTQKWWLDFIGTTNKTSISCGDYKPVTAKRHLQYVYKMLSGAIYTAMNLESVDTLLNNIVARAQFNLNAKHAKLCNGIERNLENMCSSQLWEFLKPQSPTVGAPLDNDYYYTDGAYSSC